MKFKDIKAKTKYIQVTTIDTRKRGGRQRYRRVNKIYVLQKDEEKKQALVSVNGLPAKWVTPRQMYKWQHNDETIQTQIIE